MENITERIKAFIYFRICEKYPVTEYAVGATKSFKETKSIIAVCPWAFSSLEAGKLFMLRYARVAISIALTGLFWAVYDEQLATALFYAFAMPSWMLPFCLFSASEILTRVLNEILFE